MIEANPRGFQYTPIIAYKTKATDQLTKTPCILHRVINSDLINRSTLKLNASVFCVAVAKLAHLQDLVIVYHLVY